VDADIQEKISECKDEESFDPQTKNDESLISRLTEGMRFNFSGALMHHLFLHEMRVDFLASIYPIRKGTIYEPADILMALFQSSVIGLPSIESFKFQPYVNVSLLGERESEKIFLSELPLENVLPLNETHLQSTSFALFSLTTPCTK
ncbi:hypothetical protein MHK_006862, partial [Candidatus Magnetomorum sp. HK-1]